MSDLKTKGDTQEEKLEDLEENVQVPLVSPVLDEENEIISNLAPTRSTLQDEKLTDFDTSIEVLYESFITWHRLQNQGIVKTQSREDIQYAEEWQNRYPEKFHMIHLGSRCFESVLIGKGKYSKVYKRGNFAYKTVKTGHSRDKENIGKLRCNIKEMCFFHSMDHHNIMKCTRSQMVMQHGLFKKLIHEMHNARCTLQQMIYAHEINCYQDFVYMMTGIVKALQYMHKYQIVHGDIKPSNILLNHRYETLISDFTLTTFENKGHEIAFGTLYWRSPECLLMRECGVSSDVWAFGMMLLDCLYGCIYMRDIVQVEDNEDMLAKLIYIIGQPPVQWVQKYIPEKKHLLYKSFPEIEEQIRKSTVQMTLSPKELECVRNLITNILQWDSAKRYTMDQILQHPFFSGKTINPLPQQSESPMLACPPKWCFEIGEKVCTIQWRARSEKDFIQRWIKYYYHDTFHTHLPVNLDWLLYDTTILVKRIVDRLKLLETTFNVKNVIKACCKFYYFMWRDYWPDDPFFECTVFHILYLLQFNIFTLNVSEIFLRDVEKLKMEEEKKNTEKSALDNMHTEKSKETENMVSFTFDNGHTVLVTPSSVRL